MLPQRIQRLTNWRSIKLSPEMGTPAPKRADDMNNPWNLESPTRPIDRNSTTMVRAPSRRLRTFTGQINVGTAGCPATMQRQKLIRIGIAAFVVADVFLAFVFLASVI